MTRIVIVGEMFYSDLRPDHGLPPGQPPGIWGGAPPYVDIGGPGSQPHPSHPIAPGGRPPGYWGGVAPPYPDHGLPGQPPGYWGGVAPPHPDQGLPGGQGGVPTHPITLPEPLPPPPPEIAHNVVVAVWSPTTEEWSVRVGEPQPTPHA
jgi:hypothetical protein